MDEEVGAKKFLGILAFALATGVFIGVIMGLDLSLTTRIAAWAAWFVAFYFFNRWKAGSNRGSRTKEPNPG